MAKTAGEGRMPKKKKRASNPMLEKTMNIVSGVVGMSVVEGVSGTITSPLARTITQQGTLPIMGLGVMGEAARPATRTKRKRRK